MQGIVDEDGQVTLPPEVMEHLGVKPGDEVDFEVDADGNVRLVKVVEVNPFSAFVGHAGPGPSTDDLMAMLRPRD